MTNKWSNYWISFPYTALHRKRLTWQKVNHLPLQHFHLCLVQILIPSTSPYKRGKYLSRMFKDRPTEKGNNLYVETSNVVKLAKQNSTTDHKFATLQTEIRLVLICVGMQNLGKCFHVDNSLLNTYPAAFPYGNGMVLHFYQQQESSTTKIVHKVINKGLKTYV